MKNFTNLVEVTKLIDENIIKLQNLNKKKETFIKLYNENKNDEDLLKKISELEKEYALILNEAKELNIIVKKLKDKD